MDLIERVASLREEVAANTDLGILVIPVSYALELEVVLLKK